MSFSAKEDMLPIEEDMHRCPACGYTDGFHVSFRLTDNDPARAKVYLICPNCHKRYASNWQVNLAG